jgi:hypothetical protein
MQVLLLQTLCYQVNSILDNHIDGANVVSARWRTRESMSLVSISIIVALGTTNRIVQDSIGWSAEGYSEMVPYFCRTIPTFGVYLCPTKSALSPMLVHHQVCVRSTVEIIPWGPCEENLSPHPQKEKLLLCEKLESAKHTLQCVKQRKRRTRNLSNFAVLNRLSSSRWLVTQMRWDWPQTWRSHSSLRALQCLKLVWVLVE